MSLSSIPRTFSRSSARAPLLMRRNAKVKSATRFFQSTLIASVPSIQRRSQATQATAVKDLRDYTRPAYENLQDVTPFETQLEWSQVSPKRYEREVDAMERFYNLQESVTAHLGVHNWMMSNGIKIHSDSPTLIDDVKNAWIALRYKHPVLSSQIEDDRWVYDVPNQAELERWLGETFFVHNTSKTSRELYPELQTRPLKKAVLHFLPQTQEVLLQSPHTHMDGMGVMVWYDNFMQELVAPSLPVFGDEGKNLLPPLTPIAHIPQFSPAQKERWDKNANEWLSDMPTIRLKSKSNDMPGKSTMKWLRFSESDTLKILGAVKKHGLSVSSAAQAAISLAARIHGGDLSKSSCATIALYDAREYISPKYAHSDLVGPHTFATPIKFPLGTFVETATIAKELFVSEKAGKYALSMSPYYTSEFPRLLTATPPPGESRPSPSNAHLTSLGSLDRLFKAQYSGPAGSVELCDLWIALDIMTPDMLVAIWTLNGQLTIQADYNEAFFSGVSIQQYLELVKKQLEEGLEIELSPEMMKPGMEAYAPKADIKRPYSSVQRTGESPWESEPCKPLEGLQLA